MGGKTSRLNRADRIHLDAAEGWLGLGSWQEANEELESIRPQCRAAPKVLRVRWHIYAAAKRWEGALEIASALISLVPEDPFGWFHRSYCLHELKHTLEARDNLLRVVDRFPKNYMLRYNLACYECQLGNRKAAWKWLSKAIDLSGSPRVKLLALEDPDLAPLWSAISEI